MSWCPNACDIIPIFTPDFFKMVANECLLVWNKIGKQSTGNEKKG